MAGVVRRTRSARASAACRDEQREDGDDERDRGQRVARAAGVRRLRGRRDRRSGTEPRRRRRSVSTRVNSDGPGLRGHAGRERERLRAAAVDRPAAPAHGRLARRDGPARLLPPRPTRASRRPAARGVDTDDVRVLAVVRNGAARTAASCLRGRRRERACRVRPQPGRRRARRRERGEREDPRRLSDVVSMQFASDLDFGGRAHHRREGPTHRRQRSGALLRALVPPLLLVLRARGCRGVVDPRRLLLHSPQRVDAAVAEALVVAGQAHVHRRCPADTISTCVGEIFTSPSEPSFPNWLTISAATPAVCGEAIDVPEMHA